MTDAGLRIADTDWWVDRLYAFARDCGASIITPKFSRYVIDLNRSSTGELLYPGQRETSLVPTITFADENIYRDGCAPDASEIAQRIESWWQPYHLALAAEIARIQSHHGRVVLWDAHSIRSSVPMLFPGQLPDLNLGTAVGKSCSSELEQRLVNVLKAQTRYSFVVNGRFKGGYITRHYGNPQAGVDAVQMEIAQCNYLDESSFRYCPELAEKLQAVLRDLLQVCSEHA